MAAALLIVILLMLQRGPANGRVSEDRRSLLRGDLEVSLRELEKPVTVRLYVSQRDNELPSAYRSCKQQVESDLRAIEEASAGQVDFEHADPRSMSDAEETADLDEIFKVDIGRSTGVYFGLVVESLQKKERIPFLNPADRDDFLPQILSMILRVGRQSRPTVGLVSPLLNISDDLSNPEQWGALRYVLENYNLQPVFSPEDWKELDAVLVFSPAMGLGGDDRLLSQHLRAGKPALICIDPYSVIVDSASSPALKNEKNVQTPTSLQQRGLSFVASGVLADYVRKTSTSEEGRTVGLPPFLSLTMDEIAQDHPITRGIDNLSFIFAGGIQIESKDRYRTQSLVRSSSLTRLVTDSDFTGRAAEQFLIPEEKFAELQSYPTVVLQEDQGAQEGSLVLVSDTDAFHDAFSRKRNSGFDLAPENGNLVLFANALDFLLGPTPLNELRAQTSQKRPLKQLNVHLGKAELHFDRQIAGLRNQRKALQEQKKQLEKSALMRKSRGVLQNDSAEMQLIKQQTQVLTRKITELQKQRDKNTRWKIHLINWGSVIGVPVLILTLCLTVTILRGRRTNPSAT